MLPIAERLRRSNLFTKAYSARKSINTPLFTLYVLPRRGAVNRPSAIKSEIIQKKVSPMTGFVVSKKTCKSACRRNKMKRRLREAYRKLGNHSLAQWYVVVLVIKEALLSASWTDICKTLENACIEATRRYGYR